MTFRIETATPLDPTPDLLARASTGGRVAGKTSCTIGAPFNLLHQPQHFLVTAPRLRQYYSVDGVSGSEISVQNLTQANSRVDGWAVGASARVERIVSGAWTVVSETTVTTCVARSVTTPAGLGSSRYFPSSTTSLTVGWEDWYRPGATAYLAVAAINADGERSAWSNVVEVTVSTDPDRSAAPQFSLTPTGDDIEIVAGTVDLDTVDGALAAPTTFAATTSDSGQSHDVSWTASAGAQGYIVARSQYASFDRVSYLELSGSPSVQAGDVVFLDMPMDASVAKADMVADRIWGAAEGRANNALEIWAEEGDVTWTHEVENGIPFIRITNAGASGYSLTTFTHQSAPPTGEAPFYDRLVPNRTYAIEIEARASGSPTVAFAVAGVDSGGSGTASLTTDWDTYRHTFSRTTIDATNYAPKDCKVTIPAGATVDLRLFVVGDAAYSIPGIHGDLTSIFGATDMLRHHHTIKTAPYSYDVWDFIRDPMWLPLAMKGGRDAGHTRAWPQVEPHFSAEELAVLAEYIWTPYNPATDTPQSKPAAYIRHQQGQTAPWSDVFTGGIFFEMGNEIWNSIAEFYNVPSVSGNTAAASTGILGNFWKAELSKNADCAAALAAEKVTWIIGGWARRDDWNTPLLAATDDAWPAIFTVADYTLGWDSGETTPPRPDNPAHWRKILNNTYLIGRNARFSGYREAAAAKGFGVGTYEAGPGYLVNGLNGITVLKTDVPPMSRMMKSVGSACSALSSWLANASEGVAEQNFFALGAGYTWHSHSPAFEGNKANAPFLWTVDFWNRHIAGGTVRELDPGRVLISSTADIAGADLLKAWRIDRAGAVYVAVANLDIEATRIVTIPGLTPGASVTRHYLTGADYMAHNTTLATKDDVGLASEILPAIGADGRLARSVPAGMAEVYELAA